MTEGEVYNSCGARIATTAPVNEAEDRLHSKGLTLYKLLVLRISFLNLE